MRPPAVAAAELPLHAWLELLVPLLDGDALVGLPLQTRGIRDPAASEVSALLLFTQTYEQVS